MLTADPAENEDDSRAWIWVGGFFAIGVLSVLVPPLAVPACALTLIGSLSFPTPRTGRARFLKRAATLVAALGSLVGIGRFAVSKAMLGMVEGGQSAAALSALWRLREIVLAEDAVRKTAPWDPDGDHVGSASLVSGLIGAAPVRADHKVDSTLLNYLFHGPVETTIGPALQVEGYYFIVCLPTPAGGWTARDGDAVDDERAERRYLTYAWPVDAEHGMNTVFFADEHERILVLDSPRGAPSPYVGRENPPGCTVALSTGGADAPPPAPWTAWKHKKPRTTLPGDTEPAAK